MNFTHVGQNVGPKKPSGSRRSRHATQGLDVAQHSIDISGCAWLATYPVSTGQLLAEESCISCYGWPWNAQREPEQRSLNIVKLPVQSWRQKLGRQQLRLLTEHGKFFTRASVQQAVEDNGIWLDSCHHGGGMHQSDDTNQQINSKQTRRSIESKLIMAMGQTYIGERRWFENGQAGAGCNLS